MALGDVTLINGDNAALVEILASATVANGVPTGNAGVALQDVKAALGQTGELPKKVRVGCLSTAGSGTMTVQLRLWLRMGSYGWVAGQNLNAGVAIAEDGNDVIQYSEVVDLFDVADRCYLEIVAIAGTSTAVKGFIAISR